MDLDKATAAATFEVAGQKYEALISSILSTQ